MHRSAGPGQRTQEEVEEVVVTGFRASLNARSTTSAPRRPRSTASTPRTSRSSPTRTWPNRCSAFPASRSRAMPAKAATSPCAASGRSSPACASTAWKRMSTTGGTDSSGGANRGRGFDFNVFASELFSSLTVRKTAVGRSRGRLARRHRRPAHRAAVRLRRLHHRRGARQGLQRPGRETRSARRGPDQQHLRRRHDSARCSRSPTPSATLIEEGRSTVRWDQRQQRRRLQRRFDSDGHHAGAGQCNHDIPSAHPALWPARRTNRSGSASPARCSPGRARPDLAQPRHALFRPRGHARGELPRSDLVQPHRRAGRQAADAIVCTARSTPNGKLVYGLFNDVDIRSEAALRRAAHEVHQYTLSGSTSSATAGRSALVGYSRSDFHNPVQTTITLDRANIDGYSLGLPRQRPPAGDRLRLRRDRPGELGLRHVPGGSSEIRIRPQGVDNTFRWRKIDLQFAATDDFKLKGGVDYKKYEFETFESRRAPKPTVPALPAGTTLADLTSTISGFGTGSTCRRARHDAG